MTDTKRLSINLPDESYEQLKELSKNSSRSMTEVIRTALGLVKIALEEEKKNNRLTVSDSSGDILKEIVLPK